MLPQGASLLRARHKNSTDIRLCCFCCVSSSSSNWSPRSGGLFVHAVLCGAAASLLRARRRLCCFCYAPIAARIGRRAAAGYSCTQCFAAQPQASLGRATKPADGNSICGFCYALIRRPNRLPRWAQAIRALKILPRDSRENLLRANEKAADDILPQPFRVKTDRLPSAEKYRPVKTSRSFRKWLPACHTQARSGTRL